jgi:diaminohydroxyphosphoribosylaminopyrimidine deaminase/5-amino-6-(5-phosphoribosylamino)uracil reductase
VQPLRVVLDSKFRTPANARLLEGPGRALVVGTHEAQDVAAKLEVAGTEVVCLGNDEIGRVDLRALMSLLAERQINELHVEAGANLNAGFLECYLADELLLYQAPVLMGPGVEIVALSQITDLASMLQFKFTAMSKIGEDLRIMARPAAGANPMVWSRRKNQKLQAQA